MSKKAISCFMCLFCLCFSAKLFASDNNPTYLADYALNWGKAQQNFADCQADKAKQESHFVLGECPSANAINLYYVASAVAHFTAASLLPERYAKALKTSDLQFNLAMYKDRSEFAVKWHF